MAGKSSDLFLQPVGVKTFARGVTFRDYDAEGRPLRREVITEENPRPDQTYYIIGLRYLREGQVVPTERHQDWETGTWEEDPGGIAVERTIPVYMVVRDMRTNPRFARVEDVWPVTLENGVEVI